MPRTKAFGYLRVSGESQVNGDGFPRQRETIERYAAANNLRIVKYFEEQGVSGTTLDRPALSDMMVALLGNGTHVVVVEKLDRIARDLMVQETLIESLRRQGFELVSAAPGEENLCSDDPGRKFMRQIMGAVAEYDKSMLVLKLRAARQRKKKAGTMIEGRKPFGFREGERATIDRMLALRNEGKNWEGIAKTLNAEDLRPRQGRQWFPASVRTIVLKHQPEN
jgi:DNA invertase Pin-like site-specific DNA recombinase